MRCSTARHRKCSVRNSCAGFASSATGQPISEGVAAVEPGSELKALLQQIAKQITGRLQSLELDLPETPVPNSRGCTLFHLYPELSRRAILVHTKERSELTLRQEQGRVPSPLCERGRDVER